MTRVRRLIAESRRIERLIQRSQIDRLLDRRLARVGGCTSAGLADRPGGPDPLIEGSLSDNRMTVW